MPKEIYKKTYGIALCRFNEKKTAEILMIKKRYTYAFFSFVFGYYKKYNTKQIKSLFNNMTLEEKIDILSMNFSILWYRIWLSNPEQNYNFYNIYDNNNIFHKDTNRINKIVYDDENSNIDKYNKLNDNECSKNTDTEIKKDQKNKTYKNYYTSRDIKDQDHIDPSIKMIELNTFYYKKKYIFESTFLKDNGKKLKKLIHSSNNSFLEWEIPKGGKIQNETELLCACRELEEETNIKTSDYSILYNQDYVTCSNTDHSNIYITKYYIGFLKNNSNYIPTIKFNNMNQISEISDIKWYSLNDVISLNNGNQNHLYNSSGHLVDTFNKILSKFKEEIKSYYYDF